MPQSVDVGSILGGRYKVTAHVLDSADHDLVLEGRDQVLNRPVSILVAAPANASQVATSAREIATGERPGTMQVLDLGVSDGQTYLVTNQAQAADLLDLVITQDEPYVEPFFTDTLGSEIFGQPRSREPQTFEDDEEYYEEQEGRRPVLSNLPQFSELPKPRMPRFLGRAQKPDDGGPAGAAGAAAAGAAGVAAAGAAAAGTAAGAGATPPPPKMPPRRPAAGKQPGTAPVERPAATAGGRPAPGAGERTETSGKSKVSLWSDEDYGFSNDDRDRETASRQTSTAGAAAGSGRNRDEKDRDYQPRRAASTFPSSAVAAGGSLDEYFEEEEETRRKPKPARFLLVGVIGAMLIVFVVLAVTQLGGMFRQPVAGPADETATQAPQSPEASESAPAPSEPAAEAAAPVPVNVTRQVPGNQNLNSETDSDLSNVVDGNPASFWASYFYSSDAFGGLAQNMALVVELEEESDINQVDVTQLNGSGGSFTVRLNDQPTLEGSTQVGQGSFTAPRITIPVDETNGEAARAKYVIIDFTRLPRTSAPSAPFPFGVQIAEVKVS